MIEALHAKGIGAGIYYPKPLHYYPHIAKLGFKHGSFPISEQVAREVLSLPIHPKVSKSDIKLIATTIRELANA